MFKTAQQLIDEPHDLRPHVVLLGAGASRAAFPCGDATGRCLPVMDDLIDVVGLRELVEEAGLAKEQQANFEVIYGQLASDPTRAHIARIVERRIDK